MSSSLRGKISIPFLIFLSFLLQTTVVPHLKLLGVQPDIILILVVTLSLERGPIIGSTSGFVGGLLKDLVLLQTLGLDALSKTLVGFFVGRISETVGFSIAFGVMAVLLGSFSGELIRLTLSYLLGLGEVPFFKTLLQTILPFSFYNALLFPPIYIFVERIIGETKEEFSALSGGTM